MALQTLNIPFNSTNEFAAASHCFGSTVNGHYPKSSFTTKSSQKSTLKTGLGNILDVEIRKIVSEMVKDTNKKHDLMFITICKIWNQIHENKQILDNVLDINNNNNQTIIKQQQLITNLNAKHNNIVSNKMNNFNHNLINIINNKFNNIEIILLNKCEEHQKEIKQELNGIKCDNNKQIITMIKKQQQQQQLQINLAQELKKVIKINNIQNKKIDELQNKINNIQLELKQSDKKQTNILNKMMNKKNRIEQQRSPVKHFGISEEKQLKTKDKINLMTNKLLNKIQHQQKIYESSLEKLNKKLDDQTNKLIYNNNFGINKLLKQTKIIKNKFKNNKQFVSHQINNINDVKNMPNVKINDQNTLFNTLTDKQKTNDNLQNFTSNNINMAEFMNQAVNTLKTANTAIATIVNDNNINYVT